MFGGQNIIWSRGGWELNRKKGKNPGNIHHAPKKRSSHIGYAVEGMGDWKERGGSPSKRLNLASNKPSRPLKSGN